MLRFLKILSGIIISIFILFVAFIFIMRLFGFSTYVITSNSMQPVFSENDLIFVDTSKEHNAEINDIITYQFSSQSPVITHRIVNIEQNTDNNGVIIKQYITKGDANLRVDLVPVSDEYYIGTYSFHLVGIGKFLTEFIYQFIGIIVLLASIIIIFLPDKNKKISRVYSN